MGGNVTSAVPFYSGKNGKRKNKGRLELRFAPYTLQLKHAFTLATSSRTTTPVMLTEIEYDGITGYGEASMPPYLGESHETAAKFLSQVNLSQFSDPFLIEDILTYIDGIMPGNYAAKACETWGVVKFLYFYWHCLYNMASMILIFHKSIII